MIEADTPTLWDLKRYLGRPAAIAILVKALFHTKRLVNLDKALTDEQVGEIANDILENHGQLKVEEVKYLLKRALRTQKVYARLDYNVVMNWVEEYVDERTEEAMRISDQEAAQARNKIESSPDATGYDEYLERLKQRAQTDAKAAELLKEIESHNGTQKPLTREERQQSDHGFKMWRTLVYQQGQD